MRQGKYFSIGILLLALALLASCRTSQQTRARGAANQRGAQAGAKQMDSLVMVQDKLLTIIDTMASVVAQDRARIRTLEIEIAKLKSMIERQNIGVSIPPPAPPVNTPMQNYNAPPPQENNNNTNNNYTAPQEQNSKPSQLGISPQSAPMEPLHQPVSYPPNEKYSAALKLFNDGRYMDALTSFDELSRVDASSQYAPNYLYWKGESLYALGQYDEAIRTFHDVLTKYPESSKADDSEFKIGASYEKLGDRRNARSAYERLTLSYPQSEYRARAEARLNKLK